MAIAHVGSQSVVNGSGSATDIVITKPAGVTSGHLLVALIGEIALNAMGTVPSGWTLVDEFDTGTVTRSWLYYKVAGPSEPGNYTWTLAVGAKAGGWIGAYSGCDTSSVPAYIQADLASVSVVSTPGITAGAGSWLVSAAISRHPEPIPAGVATTWTNGDGLDSERADQDSQSTGNQISFAVYDSNRIVTGPQSRTLTASAAVARVAAWSIALAPAGAPPSSDGARWGIHI